MATYRLDLAYDGSGFRGYALQVGQRTVQGELESALSKLMGSRVEAAVAGRTDAGVHARGQVVSVHLDAQLDDLDKLQRSLNGLIGPEISVTGVREEADDFHARFSANWRRYLYRIDPRPAPDPLLRHMAWHVGRGLDREAMRAVASAFEGQHDFSSFCKSVEGKSNVRRVEHSQLREADDLLEFWIKANAFCHQMVRSLVGYMYDVGRGFLPPDAVAEVIAAGDRSAVATVAPPHGLTLWEVGY